MDNTTHKFSFASSPELSAPSNQFKIPDLRDKLSPKISTGAHQDDFISLTINKEKWRPVMPIVTPFISPLIGPTVTSAIASFRDNDIPTLNLQSSEINENSTAGSGIIHEQNHQPISDEGRINNFNGDFIHSYRLNTGENSAANSHDATMTQVNHSLYINPSIVLSEDRAFYQGPGTPMPKNMLQNYYPSQHIDQTKSILVVDNISTKKKRSRGKKNAVVNIAIKQSGIEKSKKLNLNIQKKIKNENKLVAVSSTPPIKQENLNVGKCKKKKKYPRLWLNKKSKSSTKVQENVSTPSSSSSSSSSTITSETKDFSSRLSCRFIDRATSPINFPQDKKIIKSNKTRDIALSPIRFIEPQLKYSRSHSDEETKMKLSSLSQTIESANKTKTLKRLFDSQYSCEKCIAMSRQMAQPICSICCAK
ncbi:hypothetical protein PV327_002857 [Microctonus hyperodae]|uniref:Uncharacterized protein n=1 Tax=Microctonus hyperodae TaxID=165561 RepID=A0AA39FGS4_MICHY|nr:hypothetical protein PV327_002857 [Microctonus hyperodae]